MDTSAADPTASQIEVTLRHASFGEYAFRCEPSELGNVAPDMLDKAREEHERGVAIFALDKQQLELAAQVAEAQRRVDAATLLGDHVAIAEETAARDAITDKIAALVQRRAAVASK